MSSMRLAGWSVSGLVADGRTESEISNGQPPSYYVAVKRANGDIDVLPNRITFDGSKYMARHEAYLRGRLKGPEENFDQTDPAAPFGGRRP